METTSCESAPARRTSSCAGLDYQTWLSWIPRLGGAMVISRILSGLHPEGSFQRLAVTGEDQTRSTVRHSFDGYSVEVDAWILTTPTFAAPPSSPRS